MAEPRSSGASQVI